MTNEDFTDWVNEEGINPVVLVEVSHTAGTFYLSNKFYATETGEAPENVSYDVSLNQSFIIQRSLDAKTIGSIRVYNDGDFDDWQNLAFINQPIKVFIGDAQWPRDDFRLRFSGIIDDLIENSPNEFEIKITAINELPNINLSGNNLLLAGTINTYSIYRGSAYGSKYYKIADADQFNQVDNMTVYVSGLAKAIAWDGAYNNAFYIPSEPSPSATPYLSCKGIINSLKAFITELCSRASMPINSANFALFPDYTEIGARFVNTLSFEYILNEVLRGIGAFYVINGIGEIEFYQLKDPETAAPDIYLIAEENIIIRQSNTDKILRNLVFTHSIDHSDISQQIFTYTASNIIPVGFQFDDKAVNSFVSGTSMINENTRQRLLRSKSRKTFNAKIKRMVPNINLGMVVNITSNTTGWREGRNGIVVGITEHLTNNMAELTIWR